MIWGDLDELLGMLGRTNGADIYPPALEGPWPLQEEGLLLQLLLIFVKYWGRKKNIVSIVQKGHVQERAGF